MALSNCRNLIFRQLFDIESWTYSYLLGCYKTKEAIIIDPVDVQIERDTKLINELDVKLLYAVNTHCHADHITGSGLLKTLTKCKSMISRASGAKADIYLNPGDQIRFGLEALEARATPGHTNGCMTFVDHTNGLIFPGDTILIRACGRTDFQEGSPSTLYDSIRKNIFSLPGDFLIFPGHDYKGCTVSTVQEEKEHNPRLTKSKQEFIEIMHNLGLAKPKKIDEALPWNVMCGPSQLGEVEGKRQAAGERQDK